MTTTKSTPGTRRILVVLTSHAQKGSTGQKTGAYLPELTHPHAVFRAAGYDVDFASVKGGEVPLDGVDRKDPVNAAFLDDAALVARLHASLAPRDVDPARYDAIFYAGGHGTMWDFPDEPTLASVAARVYEAGGVVGAVCHGPAALVNVTLSSGRPLVEGKRVAAFTNEEERAVGLAEVVPFLLADALTARGAVHVPAPNWAAQVVVSERLVTGQNPASAHGVAEAIVRTLAEAAHAA
jgi:putative intracellular protease/amidase